MEQGGFYIKTTDGVNLYFRFWQPDTVNVCLCVIHGWGTSSQWYEPLARYFVNHQIAVTAIDLRGHGNSEGKAYRVNRLELFNYDIEALLNESKHRFPAAVTILLGHQLGAILALQHYMAHKNKPDALILSAPFFKPALEIPAHMWRMLRAARIFLPFLKMDVSKYLGITLPTVNADQTVPPMNLKLLCEVQKKGKRMITQGYRINIPLLVIHGSEDNISLPKSSVVFSRNTGIYTTFKSLTGKDHFLTERYDTEVFGYMLQWLKSNLHILHVQA